LLAEIEDEDEEEDYYYDMHPTKEDLMSESIPHLTLIRYLLDVLEQLFLTPGWLAAGNLKIYQTPDKKEYPLALDVAFLGE
jgi:hypothetical protein